METRENKMGAVFVTERIILLSAPENTSESSYRLDVKQTSIQLQRDYGPDHYLIMNVSEPRTDLIRLNHNHVRDYGWPATLAPPLERLCAICKQADVWMNSDPRNVLIIHCKGGLGRAALVVGGYMHYTSICATPNQALDRYAMKHFFDDELKRHILPSQRRYVQYFSGLLSGSIRINSDPVYLHTISLIQVANFDGKAGCRPCFKIYQNNDHIWTSEVYSMSESEGRRILTIHLRPSLQLRGDILIKCYHHKKMRPDLKDTIFRCQLHTCAIQDGLLIFNKGDLDEANNDIRFREDARVELIFSQTDASVSDGQPAQQHPQLNSQIVQQLEFFNPIQPDASTEQNHLSLGWNETFTADSLDQSEISEATVLPVNQYAFDQTDASICTVKSLTPTWDHAFVIEDTIAPFDPRVTYARVQKKPSHSTKSDHLSAHGLAAQPHRNQSGASLDSGISAAVYSTSNQNKAFSSEMDRRSPSPGGTLKSVKFRDVPDSPSHNSHSFPVAQRNGGASLRSGMEVVDLDALQPDMEELDRVFESLQADTEDLEQQHQRLAASSSSRKEKDQRSTSLPPKYQDPRRVLESDTGTGVRNGVAASTENDSIFESETETNSLTGGQDGNFISSYVPQDRKGLGKKYGAFTFGLPTTRPELKSITSPQPKRRDREPPAFLSDHEQSDSDPYGRSRLRHVDNETARLERSRAEERLYNTSAPSPSPTLQQSSRLGRSDPPQTSDNSTYGRIMPKHPPSSPIQSQSLPRRVPSPTPPRPKTPTEEERLQRLLNVQQREFLVDEGGPQDRYKSRLKEIAREGQSQDTQKDFSHQTQSDVNMESEGIQTDPEESPLPERKKKKKGAPAQTQTEAHVKMDANSWLQLQHDKLMRRKYGADYIRRKNKETALLEELRSSHQRMIQQVPNRDLDENRLPLSSIILREAKTPPLVRREGDEDLMDGHDNPGYALVRSQLAKGEVGPSNGSYSSKQEIGSRIETHQVQPSSTSFVVERRTESYARGGDVDTDHDSITDEIDFGDEPLYKSPASYRASRSREIDESRLRSVGGSFSNPTSPDQLRRATAASPKSILKNTNSINRGRYATSEDRAGVTTSERAPTPNFPAAPEKERGSLSRNNSLQRGYNLYGTRERANGNGNVSGRSTPTGYFGMSNSRRSSLTSINPGEAVDNIHVIDQHPVFVRDLSKFWYKPGITREETIDILKDKPAGTFLIRDSNSFPGAFGLAVKVDADHMTKGQTAPIGGSEDLVRHFLIEPSAKGVHLKGCQSEPVFASLPALVYQHSVTALALPCRLLLPESDATWSHQPLYSEDNLQRLMDQGAACNVFYLLTLDTESLTGPQAIRRAMTHVQHGHPIKPTVVHFKVNAQGIILTDNKRRVFFRRHYPIQTVSFCGLDPDDRRWSFKADETSSPISARCFGFVSRKPGSYNQNECHLFAELESEQPAGAVVSFVTKVMMSSTSVAERRSNVAHSHSVDQKAAGPFTSLDSTTFIGNSGHSN